MKRILTIQDVSCLGKCSLTVALPLLSAMGIETVILPTAVLSTHTMFKNFTCMDLSDELTKIVAHWKSEGVTFDAVYTGYLGTEEEIETVRSIIRDVRAAGIYDAGSADPSPAPVIYVDPAMGDHGKLYPAFDEHYAKKNALLCGDADIIVPNITEASFMTGLPYRETYDEAYVKELLGALTELGCGTAVLTGVSLSEGKTGVMGYEAASGEYFSYQNDWIPAVYHGTGDIFSSVLVGAVLNGIDWFHSMKLAADYTAHTIEVTMRDPHEPWYGVNFEETIPALVDDLRALKTQS